MANISKMRLNVNLDQVAAIRAARGGTAPDIVRAARMAAQAGADSIGFCLDQGSRPALLRDVAPVMGATDLPFKLEVAALSESVDVALAHMPDMACIRAPGARYGAGLDVVSNALMLAFEVGRLNEVGIRTSLYVQPEYDQLAAARDVGAHAVELYIGAYCEEVGLERERQLEQIWKAAEDGKKMGLECHAGHGLTYETIGPIAVIPEITTLNIGHFLIAEAIFIGLDAAVRRIRALIDHARTSGLQDL